MKLSTKLLTISLTSVIIGGVSTLAVLTTSCGGQPKNYVWKSYDELIIGDLVKSVNFTDSLSSGEQFQYNEDEETSSIILNQGEMYISEHVWDGYFDLDIGYNSADNFNLFAAEVDSWGEFECTVADNCKSIFFSWNKKSASVNFNVEYVILSIEKTEGFIGILDFAQYWVLQ